MYEMKQKNENINQYEKCIKSDYDYIETLWSKNMRLEKTID